MKKTLSEAELKRKIRRKKIRKRRILVFLSFLIVIGIAVFCVLLNTKLFPVKTINANGSKIYSSEQIIKASGIGKKTPIFSISESKVKEKVSKKLPYIEDLKIKITFPDTVAINVSDAKEHFSFKTENGYFAASKNLHILKKYSQVPEKTLEVVADINKGEVGSNIVFSKQTQKDIFDSLILYTDEKLIKVNKIDLTDSLKILLFVEDRFEVNLGNRENLKEKISHLAGMISEIGDRKGKINLEMWSKNDSKGTFIAENQT